MISALLDLFFITYHALDLEEAVLRFKLKKQSSTISYRSFEFTDCSLDYSSSSLRIVVVYRPPPSEKNRLNVSLFLDEFSSLLERLITTSSPLIIDGDFNFYLYDECHRAASRFQDQYNLKTHK